MRRIVIGSFTAVVLLILFVVLFTYVKRPYERVLLDRFGTLIPEEHQTRLWHNWYFKMPTDSLVRVDTRLHLKTFPLLELTANGEPVGVRPYVVWRIVDPVKFRNKTGGSDQQAEKIMDQSIRGLVGQEIPKHKLDEFFSSDPDTEKKTHEVEAKIAQDATNGSVEKKIPGLADLGIEIADMGFSRIAFPPANTEAVYTRMVSELTQKAQEYQATGLAKAQALVSQGAADAAKTRGQAVQDAQGIRGRADAAALDVLAKVANTDESREFYQYWKSLDFLQTALAKNTILVLSSDSPFLSSLFRAPKNTQSGTTPSGVVTPVPASGGPAVSPIDIPMPPTR